MPASTAYILVRDRGWKYTFDGVISIAYAMSMNVQKETDSSLGTDYINSARNEPDVVTLSVAASDVNSGVENWSAQMLESLAAIKEKRALCRVVTSLRSYDSMLLTDISVLQDETCPCGWVGTLTFTRAEVPAGERKTDDNASTPVNSGYAAGVKTVSGGSTFQTILREAGIKPAQTNTNQ